MLRFVCRRSHTGGLTPLARPASLHSELQGALPWRTQRTTAPGLHPCAPRRVTHARVRRCPAQAAATGVALCLLATRWPWCRHRTFTRKRTSQTGCEPPSEVRWTGTGCGRTLPWENDCAIRRGQQTRRGSEVCGSTRCVLAMRCARIEMLKHMYSSRSW